MTIQARLLLFLVLLLTASSGVIWFLVRPDYEKAITDERIILVTEYQQQRIREAEQLTGYWLLAVRELINQVEITPGRIENTLQNYIRLFPDLTAIRITETMTGEFIEIKTPGSSAFPDTALMEASSFQLDTSDQIMASWIPSRGLFFLYSQIEIGSDKYRITAMFGSSNLEGLLLNLPLGEGSFSLIWLPNRIIPDTVSYDIPRPDNSGVTMVSAITIADTEYLQLTSPVRILPILHSVYVDLNLVLLPVRNLFIQNLYLLIGSFLLLGIGGWWLTDGIRKPVEAFIEDVEPFAQSSFGRPFRKSALPELRNITSKMEEIRKKLDYYKRINVEKIILQEQRNRLLMIYATEMVALFGDDGHFTFVNKRLSDFLVQVSPGKQPDTISSFLSLKGVTLKNNTEGTEEYESIITKTRFLELDIKTYESHLYYLNVHEIELRDQTGKFIGGLIIINDITRDREVDRMRTEMIHIIVHELQNPVAGALGLTDLLIEDLDLSEDDKSEFYRLIKSSINTMSGLIGRFLAISKLESGNLQIERVPLYFNDILLHVATSFRTQLSEKNLKLNLQLDHVPLILASEDLMEDVARNLISNAIKYGDPDRTIDVRVHSSNGQQFFSVTDYGFGIPEEEREKIFQKFYRIKAYRNIKGNGLGMAYVKEVIVKHGGTISIESNTVIGTRFTIKLPEKIDSMEM